MILRAKQDGNVLVLELEGHLDYETTTQFEDTCTNMIAKTPEARVIFNLDRLRFVGSSGINQFIKVMKDFNTIDIKPRLCHVSSEFEKMFRAYQTTRNPFEIVENEKQARESFDAPVVPKKPGRKKATPTDS